MWSQTCNCDVKCQFLCNKEIAGHSHGGNDLQWKISSNTVKLCLMVVCQGQYSCGVVYCQVLTCWHIQISQVSSFTPDGRNWDIGVIFRLDMRQKTLSTGWSYLQLSCFRMSGREELFSFSFLRRTIFIRRHARKIRFKTAYRNTWLAKQVWEHKYLNMKIIRVQGAVQG